MRSSALVLALMALALAWPIPPRLARQPWQTAAPGAALVLWQAVGLAGGMSAVGALTLSGLSPLGSDVYAAVRTLLDDAADGGLVQGLAWYDVLALATAAGLSAWLFGNLASSTVRTLRSRRRHRAVLDLVTSPQAALGGARLLDDAGVTAYCLPGLRPRVVVSAGTLAALDPDELGAVLAHERAHATQRHDLVVLPFVALAATFPRLPAVRVARAQVALLVELLADDTARAAVSAPALASALARVGGAAPADAKAAVATAGAARLLRLLEPPPGVPGGLRATAYAAAGLLVLAPTAVLLGLPLLAPR